MRHTLSILVENQFGVLARIAGMFSGRGFNIDALNAAPALDPSTSRLTIVVHGNEQTLEQVRKQLSKLINVLSVEELNEETSLHRELVLMRVQADPARHPEIIDLCARFDARIIETTADTLVLEMTDSEKEIAAFLKGLESFAILDLTRTSKVALARGDIASR